jgi:hypothetical protein
VGNDHQDSCMNVFMIQKLNDKTNHTFMGGLPHGMTLCDVRVQWHSGLPLL